MLTKQQAKLMRFLDEYLKAHGYARSFEEMKNGVGLRSKSGIHRIILALEERGFIRRLPDRARAIEILRMMPGNYVSPAIAD